MSEFIQIHKCWLLPATLAAAILAVVLGFASWTPSQSTGPQEITLIAKDVAFFLADHPNEANPPLQLTRGRSVKLILRNDEPEKVLHCFTIGGLEVKTTRELSTGESEVLSFTPGQAGTFAYACLMHQGMSGKVVVQ